MKDISLFKLNNLKDPLNKFRFLREKFKLCGVTFSNTYNYKSLNIIKEIGYFNLKNFVHTFSYYNKYHRCIYNLNFQELYTLYCLNRTLREYILKDIEIIEISLENNVAQALINCSKDDNGKYDKFGYLKFKQWFNIRKEKAYYSHHIPKSIYYYGSKTDKKLFIRHSTKYFILNEQLKFKSKLLRRVYCHHHTLKDFHYRQNRDSSGFPIPPLMVTMLTFGELMHMIMDMNNTAQEFISRKYGCSTSQLRSWVGCLHLVRNVCAHNSNLLNLRIHKQASVNYSFSKFIYYSKKKSNYSNALFVVICIINHMMEYIKPHYNYFSIIKILKKIICQYNKKAHHLGLKNYYILDKIYYQLLYNHLIDDKKSANKSKIKRIKKILRNINLHYKV